MGVARALLGALGICVVGLLLFVSGVRFAPSTSDLAERQVDGSAHPWKYRLPDGPSAPPSEARVLEAELDEDGQSDSLHAVLEAAFAGHVERVETPPSCAMRELARRGGLVATGLPRGPPPIV